MQPIRCDLSGFGVLLTMKYLSSQDFPMTRQLNIVSQLLRVVLDHDSRRHVLVVLAGASNKRHQRNTAWPEPHERMHSIKRRHCSHSPRRNVSPRTAWAWRALNLYRRRLARKY